jgi:hypothetical protein
MGWVFWAVVILFGLAIIGKVGAAIDKAGKAAEEKKRISQAHQRKKNINAEAQEIADRITTVAQFRALEERMITACDRESTLRSDRAIENARYKADVLQAAVDILSLTFKFQFLPKLDLDSPKGILDRAYKVYSRKQYKEFAKEKSFDKSEWRELGVGDEEEECEVDIQGLRRFRRIVDSNVSRQKKIGELNKLLDDHIDLFNEFIDFKGDLTPGDQYFAWQMGRDGLPLAVELYKQGYTTPEKCLEIEQKEFERIEGADPQKLQQLIRYQVNVRGDFLWLPNTKTSTNRQAEFKADMP